MPEESKPALINVSNLAGLSAPLTKLIETVGAGGGRLADGVSRIANVYWLASRDAKNEAERILLVESAKTKMLAERTQMLGALAGSQQRELKSLDITDGEVSAQLVGLPREIQDLQERSVRRASYENLKQQVNWEAVTGFAAEVLAEETTIAPEPVDPDWTTRLRGIAQDVSSEEMQAMWGKLLAGEVKEPGSYSLRTLEVLRNLTQREAAVFQNVAALAVVTFSSAVNDVAHFVYKGDYVRNHIEYNDLLKLFDCGLLSSASGGYGWTLTQSNFGIRVGSKVLSVEGTPSPEGLLNIQVYNFTLAGNELLNLVSLDTPIAYLEDLASLFKTRSLSVSYANFIRYKERNTIITDEPFLPL